MFRPGAGAARSAVVSIGIVVLILLAVSASLAATGPSNVVVVMNARSSDSCDIANYYMAARGIPANNLCLINCSTSEIVSRSECETNILTPVRAFLQNPAISDHIDYIVLTKGVPLGADYGFSTGALSVTSIMTCIDNVPSQAIDNPYGPMAWDLVEVAFSHQLDLNGRHLYLVTRLDAYTTQDVHTMIDRSLAASPLGPILLDATPGSDLLNMRLSDANSALIPLGIPVIYDKTPTFLANQTGLMGYFSWGSNDSSYTYAAYVSNKFVPGSLADTYVSSSGRTFNPTSGGQSLIADLIAQGACGLNGFVSEPYQAYTTYPDILFSRYVQGYNMAESFYAATPKLFWKSVVVGDPLMAPYATAPVVMLQLPSLPLTGLVAIGATATDDEGIAKVDFYLDGNLVGTSTNSPYSVQVDSTLYSVGKHKIEARATDAGPVATEGSTSATIDITNPVSMLHAISEAFPSPDGQVVLTVPKIVTAGTAEMGGKEFYIEESNRSCGIRVASTVAVREGDMVVVSGPLATTSGERSVEANDVQIQPDPGTPLSPIGMVINMVGGADICANTKGITGGWGPRNIGLLVKTCGKTTYIGGENEDFFYVDDGSGLKDGSGHIGVKIRCRDLVKPALGVNVLITGISSCEDIGVRIIPTIKVRRQSDVKVMT